jgi:hypothetical protein
VQSVVKAKNSRQFGDLKMIEIVPISAPGRNSRNKKYIKTSVTGRSLHHLTEFVTRRLQEEMLTHFLVYGIFTGHFE